MLVKHIFCLVLIIGVSNYVNGYKEYVYSDEAMYDELDYPEEEENPDGTHGKSLKKCKEYHPIEKVVHGKNAEPKEYPHMALLGYGSEDNIEWLCGGSLISDQFILTAAHCLYRRGKGNVKFVRLGELDVNSTTDDADLQEFTVKEVYPHHNYHPRSHYDDIALLKLDKKVNITNYVIPACLALTAGLNDTEATVTGWGYNSTDGKPTNILQTALVTIIPQQNCSITYGPDVDLKDGIKVESQMCAFGTESNSDTCQGDSGGPLQIVHQFHDTSNFYVVLGVTSFGKSCGEVPTVYTRVRHYVPWIENIVWK